MPSPLVSADWLQANIAVPGLRIVDASWFPSWVAEKGAGRSAFERSHIAGAVYFDIDEIADIESDLPHMLPDPAIFASCVQTLGIGDDAHIITYDCNGFFASARVWWMFRAMGHDNVSVLNGGLPAWQAAGGKTESGVPAPKPAAQFTPTPKPELVVSAEQVADTITLKQPPVLDARPVDRFTGRKPEPRRDLKSGHIPGSINVPASLLVREDGTLLDAVRLEKVVGAYASSPAIATCGSGVSAAIIAMALAELGNWDVAIYDGSWSDWARGEKNPIEVAQA